MTNAQYIPGVAELGRKNQPGGYVGIDGSGDVLGTFAQRRDTAANIAGIVLKNGELAFTTDTQEMFIGDGVTAGGQFLWQQCQRQTKIGINTLTAFVGTAPDSGLSIPIAANRPYRVRALAAFTGGTDSLSNFQLVVYGGGSLTFSDIHECWTAHGFSGQALAVIEDRRLAYPDVIALGQANMLTDLTRQSAILRYEFVVSHGTATNLILAPCVRTGSSSPAKASVLYEWRRIV